MGALGSLSKSVTLCLFHTCEIAVAVFGLLLLIGWIGEIAKAERWKAYHTAFVILAIVGVAGEWIADIGIFMLSEHLQTIDERQINELTAKANGTLSAQELSALSPCLRQAPKGVVYVAPKAFDDRALIYAGKLRSVLADAGFDARDQPNHTPAIMSIGASGMVMFVRNQSNPPSHANPIQGCFALAKLNLPSGQFNSVIDWLTPTDVLIGVSEP